MESHVLPCPYPRLSLKLLCGFYTSVLLLIRYFGFVSNPVTFFGETHLKSNIKSVLNIYVLASPSVAAGSIEP